MIRTEASVDLAAIRTNVAVLAAATFAEQTRAQVMAMVDTETYGDALPACAGAALDGGATWLAVPDIDQALTLRSIGITAPIFVAGWSQGAPELLGRAVTSRVDLPVDDLEQLAAAAGAADQVGDPARVHLRIDTGCGTGISAARWPELLTAAARAQADARVEVIGVWSELTASATPDDPRNDRQLGLFHDALRATTLHGIVPEVRHLADAAATLTMPGTHFDLVRAGEAVAGRSPVPGRDFGLVPALRP